MNHITHFTINGLFFHICYNLKSKNVVPLAVMRIKENVALVTLKKKY